MAGRPPKENSRDKQYRIRLNDEEENMLVFCSVETGKTKSEIFRKSLKAYYENIKCLKNKLQDKENDFDYNEYDMDHISLVRSIECPYCGVSNNIDFSEVSESSSYERKMGPEIEYSFEMLDYECEECAKCFRVYGSIWEYPIGAYNYEDVHVEKYDEDK